MNLSMPPFVPAPFNGLAVFGWISIFLLIGIFLRAKIPVFRRFLIPSCIIGGTVGFLAQSSGLIELTGFPIDNKIMQNLVFHLFNIVWVFIGLKVPVETSQTVSQYTKEALWTVGFSQTIAKLVAVVAMTTTTLLAYAGLNKGPLTLGTLTSDGFLAGPGPALAMANVWSQANSAFIGLQDYALASGAMGFVVSIVVGIPLVNIIARKKNLQIVSCPSEEMAKGFFNFGSKLDDAGKQTTTSTSIDVLAWHLAFGIGTYLLATITAAALALVLPKVCVPILWSMFFLFCLAFAVCIRKLLTKANKHHLLDKGMNTRISNACIDFLVCGTFMGIGLGNIVYYIVPFLTTTLTCTLAVAIPLWLFTHKLKKDGIEFFAYLFGNYTGTVSTAFVLLRIVDPEGKSSVVQRMAVNSLYTVPIAMVSKIFFQYEPVYGNSAWVAIGVLAAMGIGTFILTRLFPQEQNEKSWQPDSDINECDGEKVNS